jgi:hypothetical protein
MSHEFPLRLLTHSTIDLGEGALRTIVNQLT